MNGIGTGRGIARGEVQGERWAGDLPGQVAASLRSERGDGGPARQELWKNGFLQSFLSREASYRWNYPVNNEIVSPARRRYLSSLHKTCPDGA